MFRIIYQSKHGSTVYVNDPKLEAYKQMAYIKMLGKRCRLICQDGAYTVEGDGLDPLTFEKQQV